MPFGTKITKKFWEKAADPIPKPMQTNMRKIFGADYELYVYAMAAYAIAGYLSGYFQLPLLYTAYMLSELTAVKSHQWHVTETFGLQRIYPFAQWLGSFEIFVSIRDSAKRVIEDRAFEKQEIEREMSARDIISE